MFLDEKRTCLGWGQNSMPCFHFDFFCRLAEHSACDEEESERARRQFYTVLPITALAERHVLEQRSFLRERHGELVK